VAPPTSFVFRSEHGPVPTEAVEVVANHSQFSVKSIDAKPGKLVVHLRNAEELDVRHEFLVTDQQGHRLPEATSSAQAKTSSSPSTTSNRGPTASCARSTATIVAA
jgi:hypothetical protein